MKLEIPIHISGRVEVVLVDAAKHKPALWGPIGPFSEQEASVPNVSVVLTDTQKFSWGPFNAIDGKGIVIGPANGVAASTGDAAVLVSSDNGDGTFEFAAGLPGQTQAVVTDAAGKTGVLDVTVTPGSEAAIQGAIGAPEEQ